MIAFYNEIDDYCCAWLSNLMDAGHITPGVISNKSIEDLIPYELIGYDRVHLFAGIGVWDYALRLAGWPSDRPVWTLSCPCQPFSSAGKGAGFDDERHLWPAAFELIRECKPVECLGEQVASGAASAWIDLVHADLEAVGYTFGCVPFPSAGVGAPHIRDRAYWVANAELSERGPRDFRGTAIDGQAGGRNESANRIGECGGIERMANAELPTSERFGSHGRQGVPGGTEHVSAGSGGTDGLEYAASDGREQRWPEPSGRGVAGGCGSIGVADTSECGSWAFNGQPGSSIRQEVENRGHRVSGAQRPGPTNGFWRDADWLGCRDGKWRPVRPGSFPLVNGAASRVGRLRAYGNAINTRQAQAFIQSYLTCEL